MDVSLVDPAITERTSAIVPVHLHGFPVEMPSLMALAAHRGVAVVEDCAQAHGASIGGRKVGGFGHAAAFSFFPTKNLGGIGDGELGRLIDTMLSREILYEADGLLTLGSRGEKLYGSLDEVLGRPALRVIRRLPERLRVVAPTAHSNAAFWANCATCQLPDR